MATTLKTLAWQVRSRLAADFGLEKFHEVVLIDMINGAQSDLVNLLPTDAMPDLLDKSTTASVINQNNYSLPEGMIRLIAVTQGGTSAAKPSQLVSMQERYKWLNYPDAYLASAAERPIHWIENNNLCIFPTPSAVVANYLVMEFLRKADQMTGDSSTMSLRDEYGELLIYGSIIKALESQNMPIAQAQAVYTGILAGIPNMAGVHKVEINKASVAPAPAGG